MSESKFPFPFPSQEAIDRSMKSLESPNREDWEPACVMTPAQKEIWRDGVEGDRGQDLTF